MKASAHTMYNTLKKETSDSLMKSSIQES
uniref:Putative disease resistance protein RGA1 n=1 Tax=Rhizophora mucronata TaxID=61149 RepID=A0A2P2LUR3_RHIMU